MAPRLPDMVQHARQRVIEVATDWLDAMRRDPLVHKPEFPYQRTSSDLIIAKNLGQVAVQEPKRD